MTPRSSRAILAEIAEVKELRSQAILKHAPKDDAAKAISHPDVLELDRRLAALRGELADRVNVAAFPDMDGADGKS